MATDRRALLVLGMHRSGTSALARILNIYGAALPSDLLPANSGNTTGYWESAAIVGFHDQLLEAAGSPWDAPVWFSLEPLSAERRHTYARQLADLVTSEYGDAPLIVVKDPRLCRLVEVWTAALALLQIQPLAIQLVRHPAEVAASLFRRDGMPEGSGRLLWLQYVLAAEQGSRGLKRATVFYDELLADCPGALDYLQARFDLTFPGRVPSADAEAAAFLRPSLRHERLPDVATESRGDLSRWLRTVHAWFECSRGGRTPADSADLDRVRTELSDAEALFGPSALWQRRREEHRAMLAEADARRWHEHSGGMEARAYQAEAREADASVREAALGVQVRELESHLADTRSELADTRTELADTRSELADTRAREATLVARVQEVASLLTEAREARVALIKQPEATLWWRVARRARLVQNRLTGGQR